MASSSPSFANSNSVVRRVITAFSRSASDRYRVERGSAPMSPQATPQQVAHFYGDDTTLLRVGLVFAFAAFGLCGPFLAEITTQLRRIQNISPVLARTQSMSSAVGWVFLAMP